MFDDKSESPLMAAILGDLLSRPTDRYWGRDLVTRLDLKGGTVFPTLRRLEQRNWLDSEWDESVELGGRRRRVYWLTASGRTEGQKWLSAYIEANSKKAEVLPGLGPNIITPSGVRL